MGHEGRINIERFPSVMGKQLEIASHMDDQEKDEEKAGQAHNQLLTEGRGEKSG